MHGYGDVVAPQAVFSGGFRGVAGGGGENNMSLIVLGILAVIVVATIGAAFWTAVLLLCL
ncbi:MAG: hypothetical protein ABSE73_13450 [Planctomycetota bacterium]